MRVTIATRLVEKAEAALVSAIETYNKPSYRYREETFALLALNAWELLLKAKILSDYANRLRSIYEYERRATRNGNTSKKLYLKRNRSGNPQTISLGRAIILLDQSAATRLSPAVKANLDALIEIRDNAAHFVNTWGALSKQILEVGITTQRDRAAALRFLINAIRRHGVPETITIDGSEAKASAIRGYNEAHGTTISIRQVRYLNNVVEQDPRAVKRITHPMLGFKSVEAAQCTLAGIELMHMCERASGRVGLSRV